MSQAGGIEPDTQGALRVTDDYNKLMEIVTT